MCLNGLTSITTDCTNSDALSLSSLTCELNVVELFVEDESSEERSWSEDWNFALMLPVLGHIAFLVFGLDSKVGQMCLLVNF